MRILSLDVAIILALIPRHLSTVFFLLQALGDELFDLYYG